MISLFSRILFSIGVSLLNFELIFNLPTEDKSYLSALKNKKHVLVEKPLLFRDIKKIKYSVEDKRLVEGGSWDTSKAAEEIYQGGYEGRRISAPMRNPDLYDLERRGVSEATGIKKDGSFLDQIHDADAKHGIKKREANRIQPISQVLLLMWCAIILATVIACLQN